MCNTTPPTTEATLYGGSLLVRFFEDRHKYLLSEDKGASWAQWANASRVAKFAYEGPGGLIRWAATEGARLALGLYQQMLDSGVSPEEALDLSLKKAPNGPDEARDAAGAYGTKVHSYTEAWNRHLLYGEKYAPPRRVDYKAAVESYQRFLSEHPNLEVVAAEVILATKALRVIGTSDVLLKDNDTGQLVVLDTKTANGIRLDHKVQVFGGYVNFVVEEYGIDPSMVNGLILLLPKTHQKSGEPRKATELWLSGMSGKTPSGVGTWRQHWANLFRACRNVLGAQQGW